MEKGKSPMITATLILQVAALVLLILAAVNVASARVSLGWAGLACWLLSELVGRIHWS
jgi:hypothetical protein